MVAFSLLPLLLIILSAEVFFRVVPVHKDSGRTLPGFVVPDKDLIWRLNPRSSGPLATNELGFRDTRFNRAADKKILLLGDSVSWGDGVEDVREVYPYLLEQSLNQESKETYEVINSAVPGYSTFQQLRYLQLDGLNLHPDMIILQFCLNDVVERYASLAQYGGDNVFLGIDTRHAIQGLYGWLIRNSRSFEALIRLLQGLARDRQEYDVNKMTTGQLSPQLVEAWNVTLSEIEGIRDIAFTNHIPFLVVIAPYRFQLDQPQKENQPQKILLDYADQHHIHVVDLLPYFFSFRRQNKNVPLFHDASHFSTYGHALTADVLFKWVLKLTVDPPTGKKTAAEFM
jgi:lysophospholipase L1-like esterase